MTNGKITISEEQYESLLEVFFDEAYDKAGPIMRRKLGKDSFEEQAKEELDLKILEILAVLKEDGKLPSSITGIDLDEEETTPPIVIEYEDLDAKALKKVAKEVHEGFEDLTFDDLETETKTVPEADTVTPKAEDIPSTEELAKMAQEAEAVQTKSEVDIDKLKKGKAYLIEAEGPGQALKIFAELVNKGAEGLALVSESEEAIKGLYPFLADLKEVKWHWLKAGRGPYLDPGDANDIKRFVLTKFIRQKENGVVIIDIDEIFEEIGESKTVRLIGSLVDVLIDVAEKGKKATMLITVNPKFVTRNLRHEFEEIPTK